LLLALLIVEGVLRIINYDVNIHPFWTYHSVLGWVVSQTAPFDEIRASGFRYRAPAANQAAHTRRVLILGDSFTLATTISYEQTYPGLLEQLLQNEGDWQVLTLAVDDWGWSQQLLALREYGLDLSPDLVISQLFPLNDFCNNCLILANTCSMQDAHRPYHTLEAGGLHLTSLYPVRKILRDRSKLAGFVENWVDDPWRQARAVTGDESDDPDLSGFFEYNALANGIRYPDAIQALLPFEYQQEEVRECWRLSEKLLSEISSILANKQIPLLAVVIPFLYTFEERWPQLRELSSAPLEPLQATEATEGILTDLDVPVLSMRERIGAGKYDSADYFISLTDGHLSELGHAELAEWIFETMVAEGWTRP
jgi:hypothetical protein